MRSGGYLKQLKLLIHYIRFKNHKGKQMQERLGDVLKACGFKFTKSLGQNFISDSNLLDAIVADSGVGEGDIVVEIGTGAGTLTAALAKKAKKVISYETDTSLKPVLEITLREFDNIEVVFKDILKASVNEIEKIAGGKYHVVANLPYYITTPVLMKFVEQCDNVLSLTLMMQKEVAQRLSAKAGTKEYGSVTVAVDFFGEAKTTRIVSRKMFYPEPNVDSAVVKITKREQPLDCDKKNLRRVVKSAFAMRRKTLANNLAASFAHGRAEFEAVLT